MIILGKNIIEHVILEYNEIPLVLFEYDVVHEIVNPDDILVNGQLLITTGATTTLTMTYNGNTYSDFIINCTDNNVIVNNNTVKCTKDGTYKLILSRNNITKEITITSIGITIEVK